ncbi:MAG: tetratricopeptide repeat protein [Bacteroidetes bacterium]|nr:tetratricopeptide repeat protein [Bacteroidota bacterium]
MSKKNKVAKSTPSIVSVASHATETSSGSNFKNLFLWVVLAITFFTFIPSLQNGFVNWDDDVNIYENKNIQSLDNENIKSIFTSDVIGNYNPLPILTFAIEYHFFGLDPKPYHTTNLVFHLLCVFFIFLISKRLGLSNWAAALIALLFGIHPMRVESVSWVTERKDVLFAFFYVWALYQYIKWIQSTEKKPLTYVGILLLFTLSLFSKIQAVSLPLSMLAIDYLMKRPMKINLLIEKIPHFLLSLTFGLIGIYMLKSQGSLDESNTYFTFIDRLFIGAYSFIVYLIKWIYPYEMSPLYSYPNKLTWIFYAAVIPIAAILYGMWKLYTQDKKAYVFGFLFFVVNIIFMLQILGAGQGFLADRFTYIPYIGLFFITGYVYDHFRENPKWKTLIHAGLFMYLMVLLISTYNQQSIWKDGDTMWTHVLKTESKTPLPYRNRAIYYRSNKMYKQAMEDFKGAIAIKPQASTYNSIGKLYFDTGETANALDNYNKAIELDSKNSEYLTNRGVAFASMGQFEKALPDLNAGIKANPEMSNGYLNRSLLYLKMNNYELALNDYNEYIKRNPKVFNMYYERGSCKNALGRFDEAIADFNIAIQNEPKGLYYQERGRSYFLKGDKAKANQDWQTAINMGIQLPDDLKSLVN